MSWAYWIDVGGTFTDCIAMSPDGRMRTCKVLSSGVVKGSAGAGSTRGRMIDAGRAGEPADLYVGYTLRLLNERGEATRAFGVIGFDGSRGELQTNAPAGIASELIEPGARYELVGGYEAPALGVRLLRGRVRLGDEPYRVRLGTTRGTNALLERKGAATALAITRGFGDLPAIGTQARPRLFDLRIIKPTPLYERVIEADERIDATGRVLRPLDEAALEQSLRQARGQGVTAVAVCFINAYMNPAHEQAAARIAQRIGFEQVSVSSALSPTIHALNRADTAVVDAYVSPVIRRYVAKLREQLPGGDIKLMTSAGGLMDADDFTGKDGLLSGPAGGVVGFAYAAQRAGYAKVIGFDMGGTSTDVSRFDGRHEYRFVGESSGDSLVAGVRVVAPMYAIETVAAGGGSICRFDGQKLTVGPDSAGAEPGPACYGRGGPLTVTDVNLFNGRIDASHFPFALDAAAVIARLHEVAEAVVKSGATSMSIERIAAGFSEVANQKMAAAIRQVSAARGYDPAEHVLMCFGGAGAQHACPIARSLGITRVLLHPLAGVLSAFGMGMADVTRFAERTVLRPLDGASLADLRDEWAAMERDLRQQVRSEGVDDGAIEATRLLDLRYEGESSSITVREPAVGEPCEWTAAFEAMHRQLYGHTHRDRAVEIATMRLEVVGRTPKPADHTLPVTARTPRPDRRVTMRSDAAPCEAAMYERAKLQPGDRIDGPAVIVEPLSTIIVDPGWSATMTERCDLLLNDESAGQRRVAVNASAPADTACDPIRLELFNNHFTHIAAHMGLTLQRTALSVNVKERLDFSCAILTAQGDLVVNAPHIPVHLGAMGESVRGLLREAHDIRPGDVYVSNDPTLGGSHLPDVTVMTPVFDTAGKRLRFFAASRAHHAEIGGVRPGSADPFAKSLADEGVVLRNLCVVREGEANERVLRDVLNSGPYPSRSPEVNLADIRAAIAANQAGVRELLALIERDGWPVVEAYMGHIRRAAADMARAAVAALPDGLYRFDDALDDGSPVRIAVIIKGDAMTVDFTGTGPVNPNSLNANPAIVRSAVMYCLRCLIGRDIPLNAGVMDSVTLVLPTCMLNPPDVGDPSRRAAVVGGNVELSQRVVDLVLGALGVAAASQGTMNNFVFGDERFGYYETIGGGAGAGPGYDGAHAVHTHMTNTRLTDVEVLEHQYPVRVVRFAIRRGSGGRGEHRGGDGIDRAIEFLKPLHVSLLTQRRVRPPFGLMGGEPGACGRNLLRRAGQAADVALGPLEQLEVAAGDVLTILTPGGGGYGRYDDGRKGPRD